MIGKKCTITIQDDNGNIIYKCVANPMDITLAYETMVPLCRIEFKGHVVKEDAVMNIGIGSLGMPAPVIAKYCAHDWKHYNGFTDSYDYCDKCGVKK